MAVGNTFVVVNVVVYLADLLLFNEEMGRWLGLEASLVREWQKLGEAEGLPVPAPLGE